MSVIIDKIKLAVKSEPEKTLVTRGLLTMSGDLTSEGRAVLENILIAKYGAEMKAAIDAVPVEKTN